MPKKATKAKTVEIEDPNSWNEIQKTIATALAETEVQKQKGEAPTPVHNVYEALLNKGFLELVDLGPVDQEGGEHDNCC